MNIFSIFSKKANTFFSEEDNLQIVKAIRHAEKQTSGEIRLFVESKNPFVDPIDRAKEIFFKLKMQHTQNRNAVLLYIAMKDKELALYADEGIYTITGAHYWNEAVKNMLANFTKDNISVGLEQCILKIGDTLKEKFPYQKLTDKNELPDDIVFGK